MKLMTTINEYDFYVGQDENGKALYNILPKGSKIPDAGYYAVEYITHIKNQDPKTFDDFIINGNQTLSYAFKRGEI